MKKVYYLSTCSTCAEILKVWKLSEDFYRQDIRTEKITAKQIDEMITLAGSAEALFSRRALLYKNMGLKDKKLSEKDYRRLILDHDTFLKRPVLIAGKKIFIGNAPNVVKEAKAHLDTL